jgi:hypothetical protein
MVSKDFAVTSGCKKRTNTFSKVSALVHLLIGLLGSTFEKNCQQGCGTRRFLEEKKKREKETPSQEKRKRNENLC